MTGRPAVPVHLHWRSILLVFVGGALGTAARYLLTLAVPPARGVPVTTVVINVVGAFALGWLLQALALRGRDEGRRRDARLFAGTGVLGGFTTYSALAVDTDGLIAGHDVVIGIVYAVLTVGVGAAATVAGIATATAVARRAAGRS